MTIDQPEVIAAGFWPRAAAKICDYGVSGAVQLLILALVAGVDAAFGARGRMATLGLVALTLLVPIVYFGWGNSRSFRTLGYRFAGLRLETVEGKPVSPGRNFGRFVLMWVALTLWICGGFLDFLWVAIDAKHRAGHDFACKTRVVSSGAMKKGPLYSISLATLLFFVLWTARLIHPAYLQAFYVPAGSMEPTISINDRILANTLTPRLRAPQNGEIVIFKAPKAALINATAQQDVDFIKRVVGTPGDVVYINNRQLFRNGMKISEPYCRWDEAEIDALNPDAPRYAYDMKIVGGAVYAREYVGPDLVGPWSQNGIVVAEAQQRKISDAKPGAVPANQFLMLGDHRSNSNDSHVWGFAPRESIGGRAMFVFWPPSHWKILP